jgi:hypothetical protein
VDTADDEFSTSGVGVADLKSDDRPPLHRPAEDDTPNGRVRRGRRRRRGEEQ